MKKVLTQKRYTLLITAVLLCMAVMMTLNFSTLYGKAANVLEDNTVQDSYRVGETLTIPGDAMISTDGGDKRVEACYLVYPDGNARIDRTFALNQVGQYTLILEADNGGKKVLQEKTFTVNNDYYALSSSDSYVEYGEINMDVSSDAFNRYPRHEGLRAFLTDGDTLTFSQPINVYENVMTDVLEFNLARYDTNVSYVNIKLTDCYDPTNALEIVFWRRIDEETYLTAGVSGTRLIGLSTSNGNGNYIIDGTTYHIGLFGTGVQGNRFRPTFKRYNNVKLTLDTTSKTNIKIYETTSPETDTRLVTEINNPELYGTRFKGFTTGDVYLSITARGFSGNVSHAEIQIGEVMGEELEALDKVALPYVDTTPPTITVSDENVDIYAGSIPVKVPEATARDTSGLRGGVDYTVWYGYQTSARRMLNVTNGTFVPAATGIYTVVYTATDVYGITAAKELYLYANEASEDGIDIEVTEIGNVPVGRNVDFTQYTLSSLCTEESRTLRITLTCPDGTTETIATNNKAYRLSQVGEYKVTYEYADVYYSGTYSYTFSALSSTVPVFDKDEIPVPDYLIIGATYSFEKIDAYLYSPTKTSVGVKAYIQYDGGNYTEINRSECTITGGNVAKVKYVCEGHDDVIIESKEMKLVNVGYQSLTGFNITKYFQGDFTGAADLTGTTYTTNNSGSASLDFINTLLCTSFDITFKIDKVKDEEPKVGTLTLTFTDFYDESNKVVVLLGMAGASAYASVNGGATQALASDWIGENFTVTYMDGIFSLGTTNISCDFGFTSPKAKLSIEFGGVTSGFKFKLVSFCGQPFRNTIVDSIQPLMQVEMHENVLPYGSTVTTAIPWTADVLSPSPEKNLLVSVYKNGQILTDVNGKRLENCSAAHDTYTFSLDAYGTYVILYSFVDGTGNERVNKVEIRDTINVLDETKPTITLNATSQNVKVGTPTSPVAYEVTDNETPADKITVWVVIYDARGILVIATQSQYTLKSAGTYTAYLYATDAAGNSTYVTYTINAAA